MYKYIAVIVFLSAIICNSCTSELEKEFQNPPQPVRPQVWWWWLQTSTNKEAITHDLEEMKAKGLSGCLILDGGVAPFGPHKWKKKTLIGETEISYPPTSEYEGGTLTQAPGGMVQWTKEWRDMVRFASSEAGRLGLDLGVFIGPAGCAAPWVTPEFGQQELVWSEIPFSGKKAELLLEIPKPSDHYKDVAVLAVPDREIIQKEEVLDLSSLLAEDGSIKWDPPAGNWIVYRFGYRPTGRNLAGVYYIDHLSSEVFEKHWENTVGLLLSEMSPEERLAFKYVECDSWEAGNPNWTKKFAEEFQERRGYDLMPYLPALAGRVLNSEEESKRIRTDYRLTISDLIANNHYGKQREMAHASGLLSYAEAAGPHQFQADVIKCVGRCDVAMGEFWMPSPHRPGPPARFLVREAATAAHTYGIKQVFAESFTSVGPNWEESPFLMKSSADQAFCDGLNWICFHTFSHRPSLEEKPGWTHSAGTHFDPTLTWWDQSGPFIDYLSRCSYMLQQGLFVADVLFYKGDGIKMKDEAQNLNAFVWEDGLKNPPPSLGKGYDYDKCNEEVLLSRLSVRDGLLVLPDGLSYHLLVLEKQHPPSLAALRRIAELVEQGASLVGEPPDPALGLMDDLEEYNLLIRQLWSASIAGERRVGKGRVFSGSPLRKILLDDGIAPDFECSGTSEKGVIDYIHRKRGDADIYFIASRWQRVEKVQCSFRVAGKQPELWDPVSGKTRDLKDFQVENGRTSLAIEFDPCASWFIVFKDPVRKQLQTSDWSAYKTVSELEGPWELAFDPLWGGPEKTIFNQLSDWSTHKDEGIRYYSGKATYTKTFDLPENFRGKSIYLDLGKVCELASVRLNGEDFGVIWTKPFRINISRALRPTGNLLEIDVVNLWPNRLIGDASLPERERYTSTNIRKFTSSSRLLPSGLLGPVRLLSETEVK